MGLYFAWLGFYNQMLVVPSIIGLLIFFYGVATAYVDDINEAGWKIILWWDEIYFEIYIMQYITGFIIKIYQDISYEIFYDICHEIYRHICYEIDFDVKNIIYYDTYDVRYHETFLRGEICHKEVGNLTMCPECPQFCDFRYQWLMTAYNLRNWIFTLWNVRVLKESCPLYRLAWMFDHSLTPLFAFFMSLWGEKHLILSVNHST